MPPSRVLTGSSVEIVTAPIPAQSPFIPADAKVVVGAVAAASPDPIPIVLLPGFEYRMRDMSNCRFGRTQSDSLISSSRLEKRAGELRLVGAERRLSHEASTQRIEAIYAQMQRSMLDGAGSWPPRT